MAAAYTFVVEGLTGSATGYDVNALVGATHAPPSGVAEALVITGAGRVPPPPRVNGVAPIASFHPAEARSCR